MATALLLTGSLGCIALAVWLVATDVVIGRPERATLRRLQSYGRRSVATPTGRRVAAHHALAAPLAQLVLRVAPGRNREQSAAQLQAAGMSGTPVEVYLASKAVLALALGAAALLLGSSTGRLAAGVLFAVAGAGIGFILPDVIVSRRGRARREQILRELPNALDLLAVIVEAGLGLDAALARYAERGDTPLAQELALLVAELRVGASRAEVFRGFAQRVPSLETQTFVRAIVAADRLGVSLSKTLRQQGSDARVRRQLVAEQTANKAPVKMLFPTVFCIFPVLFVVVLGPALINLLGAK